ncbi:hypothetical protein L2Y96_16155 [Luteibacter aegosomaticola]|uniref:hypothetical protein n=1 Tax=Luteibacter aegosomaticola TaxID=2911538 RepID=UPI001FFB8198|nr:hypothetical protein [Luteibacter aegosomaticola]UPG88921.1 hypothetical protein L2Y96_16155 [Luteibacter aegosomaticola]
MATRSSWDPYRPVRSDNPARDVLWSILAHAIVLGLVYYLAQRSPSPDAARKRVDATRNAAFQAAAAQRLNDMASIESALAQRSHGPAPPPVQPARSAQEALAQARARYDALKQTHADLPALPKMPHTEAEALAQLAQLKSQAAAALAREIQAAPPAGASTAGAAAKGGPGGPRLLGAAGDTNLTPFEVASAGSHGADIVPRGRFSTIPPLDAPVRATGGRSVGAGGTYANRLYVDTWYVVGPFEAIGDHPLDHPELPEIAVDLDGTYAGKFGTLTWRYVQASEYPLFLPDPAESAIYYGYTELSLDRDMEIWAWIGADDDAKLWVDDQLVWKGGAPVKPWFMVDARSMRREIADYNLSEGKVRLRLSAGRHRLLFKLYNGSQVMFFSLVLSSAL